MIDRRALLRAGLGAIALGPLGRPTGWAQPAPPGSAPLGTAPLTFPRDHGAHPDHGIEWWYMTGWLWPDAAVGSTGSTTGRAAADADADSGALGFQVTFFRARTGIDPAVPGAFAAHQLIIAHAALADPAHGSLLHDQRIARTGFGIAAASEVDTDITVDRWSLRRTPGGSGGVGGSRGSGASTGSYAAVIEAHSFALRLTARPDQPLLLQGDAGISRKGTGPGEYSFYYSQPHLAVSAELTRRSPEDGPAPMSPKFLHGEAWLDHEWSNQLLDPRAAGWDWVGINLLDGGALTAFRIRAITASGATPATTPAAAGRSGAESSAQSVPPGSPAPDDAGADTLYAYASLRDAHGKVQVFGPDAVRFTALRRWTSPRTRAIYPVAVRIQVGTRTFDTQPLLDDQELDSQMSTGAVYWEGACRLLEHDRLVGRGYLEMTGYVAPIRL